MSLVERPHRRRPEINIVPLVDVLIVLIFFFLVSMQFRNVTTLNLVLPKIETAGKNKIPDLIEIAVDAEGKFFYNGTEMTREQLEQAVKIQGTIDKEIPVLLMADEETYLKSVTFVMDTCRKAGLEKVRLQSR